MRCKLKVFLTIKPNNGGISNIVTRYAGGCIAGGPCSSRRGGLATVTAGCTDVDFLSERCNFSCILRLELVNTVSLQRPRENARGEARGAEYDKSLPLSLC